MLNNPGDIIGQNTVSMIMICHNQAVLDDIAYEITHNIEMNIPACVFKQPHTHHYKSKQSTMTPI